MRVIFSMEMHVQCIFCPLFELTWTEFTELAVFVQISSKIVNFVFSSKMLNFAISFVFRPKRISCVPKYNSTVLTYVPTNNLVKFVS